MNEYNNEKTCDHYSGNVWVSKSIAAGNGGNVCWRNNRGEFVVIAHLNKEQAKPENLDKSVRAWVKAYGCNAIQL